MAHCEITRLSKKEARFIIDACTFYYGVYDFENNTNAEFRKQYGIQKEDVTGMAKVLSQKMQHIVNKLSKTQQPCND